jgi:hypothetical protein
MSIELSKEEKIQIIYSHQRNLKYSKYSLEIDILQENAKVAPSETAIASLQSLIAEVAGQLSALDAELAVVSAE